MTSRSSGYRAVCSLCKTVLVSSMPHGRYLRFSEASKAVRTHVLYRCEAVTKDMKVRELDAIADNSVEVIEGAA